MDSMIFDPSAGDPVRTVSPSGGVYRTTVGPAYYESWSNFPEETKFVSTLNLGNDSLKIAQDMAVASVKYAAERIEFFELGNEPTNYPAARWNDSTAAYVAQWKQWTHSIDIAVNEEYAEVGVTPLPRERWQASSATTDHTDLHVRPVDIIPYGVDSADQVAQYSIHFYAFSTCDPARAAIATIPNILNHTGLIEYAEVEIVPSARAALASGKEWIIGEFNSISCSGNPNVSDTFAQALWTLDVELLNAVRNASQCHLHQGATLVFQSSDQSNSAGANGSPGFSTYDMLYPRDSEKRGKQRALPSFVSLLFLAEAFARDGVRVAALETPSGLDPDRFAAYAFYAGNKLNKLALLNMNPFYPNSTEDYSASFDVLSMSEKYGHSKGYGGSGHKGGEKHAWVKRMTAPYVNTQDTSQSTWAGQSFEDGSAVGELDIEKVGRDGMVTVRGSEAVLIYYDEDDVYGA